MSKRNVILILIGVLALGAFFRFYQITEIPPGLYPDEAMNGNNALGPLITPIFPPKADHPWAGKFFIRKITAAKGFL